MSGDTNPYEAPNAPIDRGPAPERPRSAGPWTIVALNCGMGLLLGGLVSGIQTPGGRGQTAERVLIRMVGGAWLGAVVGLAFAFDRRTRPDPRETEES